MCSSDLAETGDAEPGDGEQPAIAWAEPAMPRNVVRDRDAVPVQHPHERSDAAVQSWIHAGARLL